MRLYSIPDMANLLQELLHTKNFHTIPVKKGEIEVVQSSGVVSQRFRVKVESVDCDPV